MGILRERPANFSVLSGDDAVTLPLIALGADGIVSVASNEIPDLMSRMTELALAGKWDACNSATSMTGSLTNEKVAGVWMSTKRRKVCAQVTERPRCAVWVGNSVRWGNGSQCRQQRWNEAWIHRDTRATPNDKSSTTRGRKT